MRSRAVNQPQDLGTSPSGQGDGSFVGRQAELEALDTALRGAVAGRPSTVLISGPPGIGKTALVQAMLGPLRTTTQVLFAAADDGERDQPFGVVHQLLAGLDDPIAKHMTAVVAGRSPPPESLATGVHLLAAIGRLEEDAPVIVVIDDVHWADRPSLEALTFMLRRLRFDNVLALLTSRTDAENMLPVGLLRLTDKPTGDRIRLDGLSVGELKALGSVIATDRLTPRVARRLHEYTEGNPLYALTLLREVGTKSLQGDDFVAVPPSLSLLLLARLSSCSEATIRLVQAAAVLGRQSLLGLTARVADVSDPFPALEEAAAASLLTSDPADRTRIRFSHPLIRAAVYSDLGPSLRGRLHERAAALSADGAALDHRVRAAAVMDETLADDLRAYAREEAIQQSWSAAGHHMLAAARLHPSAEVRSASLVQAAAWMVAASDFASVSPLEEEVRALPPSPWRDYVLADLTGNSGRLAEATSLLENALRTNDPELDPDLHAVVAYLLGLARLLDGDHGTEAADLGMTALRLSSPGSPARLSWMVVLFGCALAGRTAEAYELARSAEHMDQGLERLGLLLGRALIRLFGDDLDGARSDLQVVEGPFVHQSPGPMTWAVLFHRAEVEIRAGRWDDALTDSLLGMSIARDREDNLGLGFHATKVVTIHAYRGSWSEADEHLAEARDRAEASGAGALLIESSVAAARLAYSRGESENVLSALRPILDVSDKDGLREHGVIAWRDVHADALIRIGRLDEAEAAVLAFEQHGEERQLGSALAASARVRGLLEAARGQDDEAFSAFERGDDLSRHLGMPLLRGQLQHGSVPSCGGSAAIATVPPGWKRRSRSSGRWTRGPSWNTPNANSERRAVDGPRGASHISR